MLSEKKFSGFKVRRQYRDPLDTVITLKDGNKTINHISFQKIAFIVFEGDAFTVWCNSYVCILFFLNKPKGHEECWHLAMEMGVWSGIRHLS